MTRQKPNRRWFCPLALAIAAFQLGGCVVVTLSDEGDLKRIPFKTVMEEPQLLLGLDSSPKPIKSEKETNQ